MAGERSRPHAPWLPDFPHHIGDWRADPRVRRLSKADRYDVLELLWDAWIEGAPALDRPDDMTLEAWSVYQHRIPFALERRAHDEEVARIRSASGKVAADARWNAVRSAPRIKNAKRTQSPPSPSPSPKEKKNSLAMLADPLFDAFWSACPKRVARISAMKAWAKLDETTRKLAAAAMRVQGPLLAQSESKFRPHPATWLNDHRWEDEPEAAGAPPPRYVTAADTRKALEADTEQHDPAVAAGLGDLLGKLKQGRSA